MLRLLSSKLKKKREILSILLLTSVTLVVFLKSLNYDFLWLDHLQIKNRESILENKEDFRDSFVNSILKDGSKRDYYRPIFKIAHSLNYYLCQESPFGFRLGSILIHILNTILLYLILLRLKISQSISLMLVLLWSLLPINLSAVVLISARADLLAAFFILSSLLSLILFLEKGSKGFMALSIVAYALALLSKEISWPFFLVVWIIIKIKNKLKLYNIGFLLLALGYLFVRFKVVGHVGSSISFLRGEFFVTALSSFAGFSRYLFKFFIPVNLSISDAFPKYSSIFNFEVVFGLILLFMLFLFFIRYVKKDNFILSLFLGWVLFFYIPISNIVPALHFWAERFFYLPGIGLIGIASYLMSGKKIFRLPLIAVILFYGIINLNYQNYFKNNEILFRRAIGISLKSEEAYNMLGYHYLLKNDYFQAIYWYYLAVQDFSGYYTYSSLTETYNNLGVALLRLKQYKEARRWFQSVVALGKDDSNAILNLKILDSIESADVK